MVLVYYTALPALSVHRSRDGTPKNCVGETGGVDELGGEAGTTPIPGFRSES